MSSVTATHLLSGSVRFADSLSFHLALWLFAHYPKVVVHSPVVLKGTYGSGVVLDFKEQEGD